MKKLIASSSLDAGKVVPTASADWYLLLINHLEQYLGFADDNNRVNTVLYVAESRKIDVVITNFVWEYYGLVMLLRMQYLTISVTFFAPSFRITEARCVSAVLTLIPRRSAASLVE